MKFSPSLTISKRSSPASKARCFGIGVEAYTVGSAEFALSYAAMNKEKFDYFDASINCICAWTVGFRNVQKVLLMALCPPILPLCRMIATGRS